MKTQRMQIVRGHEHSEIEQFVKIAVFGPYGIGKTSLLKSLPEEETLCIDLEAGLLSVQDWKGDRLSMKTWHDVRDFACILGGPNPGLKDSEGYSNLHFKNACASYGDPKTLAKYKYIFIDSITVASRVCLNYADAQQDNLKRLDKRASYGTLASEMVKFLVQLQHVKKHIIFVGLLEQKFDAENKVIWVPQCEGSKTANEIPGILDEVISMVPVRHLAEDRSFVCHTVNKWGYPAKDRSGRLEVQEEAHLGKLIAKIRANDANLHTSRMHTIQDKDGSLKEISSIDVIKEFHNRIAAIDCFSALKKFQEWSDLNIKVKNAVFRAIGFEEEKGLLKTKLDEKLKMYNVESE